MTNEPQPMTNEPQPRDYRSEGTRERDEADYRSEGTRERDEADYRSEGTRERAEAMSPGPGTPVGIQEEERQREVAETVNLGPNTDELGLDERAEHRARQVNPGAHGDLTDDDFNRGAATRMNPGPQE